MQPLLNLKGFFTPEKPDPAHFLAFFEPLFLAVVLADPKAFLGFVGTLAEPFFGGTFLVGFLAWGAFVAVVYNIKFVS